LYSGKIYLLLFDLLSNKLLIRDRQLSPIIKNVAKLKFELKDFSLSI